jgi:hypothetical protein
MLKRARLEQSSFEYPFQTLVNAGRQLQSRLVTDPFRGLQDDACSRCFFELLLPDCGSNCINATETGEHNSRTIPTKSCCGRRRRGGG